MNEVKNNKNDDEDEILLINFQKHTNTHSSACAINFGIKLNDNEVLLLKKFRYFKNNILIKLKKIPLI